MNRRTLNGGKSRSRWRWRWRWQQQSLNNTGLKLHTIARTSYDAGVRRGVSNGTGSLENVGLLAWGTILLAQKSQNSVMVIVV